MKIISTFLILTFFIASCSSTSKKLSNENLSESSIEDLNNYLSEKGIKAEMTESGLCYVINNEGTGKQAEPGKKIAVHYTGKFADGKVFDTSKKRNSPIEFVLGAGQVIKGWDEGIALFKEGGDGTLFIPYELAYGEKGRGPIGPKSMLVFDIELVSVD